MSHLLSVIKLVSTRQEQLAQLYQGDVQQREETEKCDNSSSCPKEAIKNNPLKKLEFCANRITRRLLYPTMFNLKESNRSMEAALACASTLSSTVRTILADSSPFCLSQRVELFHSSLGILQNTDSMPLHVRQAAASTLTFMVHLLPDIRQLTRCPILRATFSTLMDVLDQQDGTIRQDIISLPEAIIKQETHFAVLEEMFTLPEFYMHYRERLETLTLFLDKQEQ